MTCLPETPYDNGCSLTLDISTANDCGCSKCDAGIPRGELIVFFSQKEKMSGWVLCLSCARKKLEAFLPVWEERQRCATVTP
jgi:hypothetical protein